MTPLLTVRQAAKSIGIGYGLCLRLVNEGTIPSVRIPGRAYALVDPVDLERFVEASKRDTKAGTNAQEGSVTVQQIPAPSERSQAPGSKTDSVKKRPYYERFERRRSG